MCITEQDTHEPRESDSAALGQRLALEPLTLPSLAVHAFICSSSHTLSNSYLDSCLRLIFLSLPPTPVLGVHLLLLIQTLLSSEPGAYPGDTHKAKGSFCHISERENQFNKYLLSTYSVQSTVCILKRKMVWPWSSGKNKNMVQPTCKCLGRYREQGGLHKVLVQSD